MNIKKIVINISDNEFYVIDEKGTKWVGGRLLGIRNMFKKKTYHEDFKYITRQVLDVIDEISKK